MHTVLTETKISQCRELESEKIIYFQLARHSAWLYKDRRSCMSCHISSSFDEGIVSTETFQASKAIGTRRIHNVTAV